MTFLNARKNAKKLNGQKNFSLDFSDRLLDDIIRRRDENTNSMQRLELAQTVLKIHGISEKIENITPTSPEKLKKTEKRLNNEKIVGFALFALGLAGTVLTGSQAFGAVSIIGGAIFGEIIGETLARYSIFKKEQNKLVGLLANLEMIKRTNS